MNEIEVKREAVRDILKPIPQSENDLTKNKSSLTSSMIMLSFKTVLRLNSEITRTLPRELDSQFSNNQSLTSLIRFKTTANGISNSQSTFKVKTNGQLSH